MKLQNKKTGEIVDLTEGFIRDTYNGSMIQIKPVAISNKEGYVYNSLAELNAEWADYEEPKEYWCIDWTGGVNHITVLDGTDEYEENKKQIGNYFETKEDADKAVEKLKAFKRLKDKGFVFKGINMGDGSIKTGLSKGVSLDDCEGFYEDMKLLFGDAE